MQNSWIVLLPPILVLILAFSTHRVIFSLLCGITTASLIFNNFSITQSLKSIFNSIANSSEISSITTWNNFINNWALFMGLFLVLLGVIIVLVNHSGGAYAYSNFIKKKLKTSKNIQTASLILSMLFFLDDYFGSLTVGSIMHPLTDKFKISRTKVAFLANAMAGSLCIIFPISSWAATIIMQLNKSGVSDTTLKGTYVLADPFLTYINTIPFVFYPLIMIFSAWFIVRKNISIGLMKKQEQIAIKTGNLFGGKKPIAKKIKDINAKNKTNAKMLDFLMPIITLITTIIIAILYTGDFYLLGGNNNIMSTIVNAKIASALFMGGLITTIFTFTLLILRKKITLREVPSILYDGIKLMGPSVLVLLFAWSFSNMLKDDLLTGQYLANLLLGHISIKLLPFLFFIVSIITTATMGTAWGCLAILIPIAIPTIISLLQLSIPVNINDLNILFPTLGAILSGSVCGNHMSPVSDVTIMSAASSGAYHMDHVRTQHSYAIPVLISSGISFIVSGFLIDTVGLLINFAISFGLGITLNFGYLYLRNLIEK